MQVFSKSQRSLALVLSGLWLVVFPVSAQLDPASTSMLDFAMLMRLFGTHTNFSAKAELRVYGKDQKEKTFTPLEIGLLARKLRVQIETGQVKDAAMSAAAINSMKQMGLDRVVSLVRPDRQATYVIFPTLRAFIKNPFTAADAAAFGGKTTIAKTPLGQETLDGRECVKKKVILTDAKGGKHEITTWEAPDMRDFPLQILTRDKEDSVVLRLRSVQLTPPEPKPFDLPTGFTQYKDVPALMTSVLTKMMKQAQPSAPSQPVTSRAPAAPKRKSKS